MLRFARLLAYSRSVELLSYDCGRWPQKVKVDTKSEWTRTIRTYRGVVENQLALGEEAVVKTLARLQAEGLGRHDALHAIGSVLAADLYELMREGSDSTGDRYARYLERLEKLKAKDWRAG